MDRCWGVQDWLTKYSQLKPYAGLSATTLFTLRIAQMGASALKSPSHSYTTTPNLISVPFGLVKIWFQSRFENRVTELVMYNFPKKDSNHLWKWFQIKFKSNFGTYDLSVCQCNLNFAKIKVIKTEMLRTAQHSARGTFVLQHVASEQLSQPDNKSSYARACRGIKDTARQVELKHAGVIISPFNTDNTNCP